MNKVIDCNKFVEVEKELLKSLNIHPTLVVINASNDEASELYIKNKEKLCYELGFNFEVIKYKEDVKEEEIKKKIMELNKDVNINGIIVQLPLYEHLNKENIINTISPIKDVDGLTMFNKGLLANDTPTFVPCTAYGIIKLLSYNNINVSGMNVVILGRSELVGLPLFYLLIRKDATVTICHSKTKDIKEFTKKADVIVSAIGKPKYITKDMIKEESVLIDVGITKVDDKIYGDMDFDDVYDKCKLITRVPGGIGLVTTIMLMYNLSIAYKLQNK